MNSLNGLVLRDERFDDLMLERFSIALYYGANPNACNRFGKSVLSLARKTKNAALTDLSIKRGAELRVIFENKANLS